MKPFTYIFPSPPTVVDPVGTPGDDALDRAARYVVEQAGRTIESLGPRPPGSEGEARLQEHLREELKRVCDGPVALEAFPIAQKAFASAPAVSGALLLFSVILYGYSRWWALGAGTAGMVVFVMEIGFYRQFLDPLFRRTISHNLFGVQKPREEVRRRLLLVGHADAAYQWRWHYRFPYYFPYLVIYLLTSMVVVFAVQLFAGIAEFWGGLPPVLAVVLTFLQWLFVPAGLLGLGFNSFREVSPGANDNLSGAFLVAALARRLHPRDVRPCHTEIVYVMTGSEEAGLRGAKEFVRRHRAEWNDVPTVAIALDTLRDLEHLHVYSRDMNGLVRHDAGVCRLLLEAGPRCGRELGEASVYLGSTDATAFAQGGVKAAALCAMDPRPAHYYHNLRDRADNMNPQCIRAAMEILLEAIDRYDRQGLDGEREEKY